MKLPPNKMRFQIEKVESLPDPRYVKLYLNMHFSTLIINTEAWVQMGQPMGGESILVEVWREVK